MGSILGYHWFLWLITGFAPQINKDIGLSDKGLNFLIWKPVFQVQDSGFKIISYTRNKATELEYVHCSYCNGKCPGH